MLGLGTVLDLRCRYGALLAIALGCFFCSHIVPHLGLRYLSLMHRLCKRTVEFVCLRDDS